MRAGEYRDAPAAALFHAKPYGETTWALSSCATLFHTKHYGETVMGKSSDFDVGFLLGVLVGEGHFGGDGRQPQITLRMHTDHEQLFRWIMRRFPGGKLYGPYHHAKRSYYQWMARGPFLREHLVPLLDAHLTADLDGRAHSRYQEMKRAYRL